MELNELRPQLVEILQERPDEFWLAYSVWLRLREHFPEQAERLATEYGGENTVGEGGDVQYSPASYIAQSLADYQVGRLYARGLSVGGIRASYEWLAVFCFRRRP